MIGHATFCVAIAYNNVARPDAAHLALAPRGLDGPRGQRVADLPPRAAPPIGPALIAGGMLAFALSFDEIIVTTFTAGNQQTLPIWIFSSSGPGTAR